ncbi:MAG: nucleotidyl transferase AbiEii/AbiGii toxin family protein [Clostridia bacterium]|nr:nucleotidyl transferase AbiEii/AbiGii toxin family protein [Clostridia bacterium]
MSDGMANSVILDMLEGYPSDTLQGEKNALRQVIHEVMLCGLSKTDFFDRAAFCGGTSLRIFHRLTRFSEDLDFSLLTPDMSFTLSDYFGPLESFLKSYGFNFTMEEKQKTHEGNVKTAFAKGNAREHILWFYPQGFGGLVAANERIRVKLEINVKPPTGAGYELKRNPLPEIYAVRILDAPSLFATKIAAVLTRSTGDDDTGALKRYQNHDKGRDLYDYIFLLSRGTLVNTELLENSLRASGHINGDMTLTKDSLTELLDRKFNEIRFNTAKDDVRPFIRSEHELDAWNKDYFISATHDFLKTTAD